MNHLLDGLDGIIDNSDSSIKRVVQSILFFDKNTVERQAQNVVQKIERREAIPVRYNSNQPFYKQNEVRQTTPSFKNKKEARLFTKGEIPLLHKETDIRVYFDSDGNYVTKKDIAQYTGHKLSGKNRSIINYNISHIWANTDNPLYFSLMWNYCLVPVPYDFLMNKRDEVSLRVQDLVKAISVELYKPNGLMKRESLVALPPQEALAEAKRLIEENKIRFVPVNN